MVVGTPEYMAPEQLMGDEVDGRADIYAVGVVLWECLVGNPPIQADNVMTLITRKLEMVPENPAGLVPDVPAALGALVLRAMARDAAERPQTAAEFAELLTAVAEDGEGGGRIAGQKAAAEALTPKWNATVR